MKFKSILVFFLTLSLLFCQCFWVLGRAGGGHSSRSSSSHSSSSSSFSGSGTHSYSSGSSYSNSGNYHSGGGSSSGSSVIIIIIIVIIIVVIANQKKRKGNTGETSDDTTGYSSDAPRVERAPDLSEKLQRLALKDSGFNRQVFEDKVATSFFEIQRAWSKRDMNPARSFISDTVFHRFSIQLEEYASKNWFNQMEELSLDKVEMLDVQSDERYDIIDVWITATARDYTVDAQGNLVSGSRELTTWDEKWSLLRSLKTQTVIKDGLQSYKCPGCGSPVQLNASAECEYCHSTLTKYDFDWVLSEITQLNR